MICAFSGCSRDNRSYLRREFGNRVNDHGFFGNFLFNDRIGLGRHSYDD
jgi:hypothetical protein